MWLVAVALLVAGTVRALAAGRDAPSASAQGRLTTPASSSSVALTTAAPARTTSDHQAARDQPARHHHQHDHPGSPEAGDDHDRDAGPAHLHHSASRIEGGHTVGDALNTHNRYREAPGATGAADSGGPTGPGPGLAEKIAHENAIYHSTLSDGLAPCWTRLGENIAIRSSMAEASKR
ncbi:MAG TPA: hypothetical protein VM287_04050 [Egibacteraceae bacterium]|nr:hypothetical protein [Egibacteraceae bacterium]